MKRAMLSMAAAALAAAGPGCSPNPPERAGAGEQAGREWARPPVIDRVERAGAALVVSGLAGPEARVVLRGDDGAAFAATADPRGRFEIRIPPGAGHLLLRPETRNGQEAAPSPDQLLILAAGQGPIAVLRPGGPTRRLDAAPALGAIDSDGRMRVASGRVVAGTAAVEVRSGVETVQVAPDSQGRWSVILPPREGSDQIRVAGREFRWPGDAAGSPALSVERLESGWRIRWSGPGGAAQTTWLPQPAGP
ncbi:hypothetical protein [uncultured Brevundimonas sp.]|uniref:hypothetical protein n=1 Tax=uncultured Brevundimonas sp. TaxID=213418 RepID=UPI0026304F36|nr:hypothetical protein [uncultured Brevundimonas sp.]